MELSARQAGVPNRSVDDLLVPLRTALFTGDQSSLAHIGSEILADGEAARNTPASGALRDTLSEALTVPPNLLPMVNELQEFLGVR